MLGFLKLLLPKLSHDKLKMEHSRHVKHSELFSGRLAYRHINNNFDCMLSYFILKLIIIT